MITNDSHEKWDKNTGEQFFVGVQIKDGSGFAEHKRRYLCFGVQVNKEMKKHYQRKNSWVRRR